MFPEIIDDSGFNWSGEMNMDKNCFSIFPRLQSDRLILRSFTEDDWSHVFAFNSGEAELRYVPRNPFKTKTEAVEKLNAFINGFTEKKAIWWAFSLAESGEFIGYGGLFDIADECGKAEIGYGLLQQYWNRGYVSEAIDKIVRYGLDDMKLHRIYAYVDPENGASRRVLEKLGFNREGTLRDDQFARGRYFDMDVLARLNSTK